MKQERKIAVFDLGGSVIAPQKPDFDFLEKFLTLLKNCLAENPRQHIIIVVGGGGIAREWQETVKKLAPHTGSASLDWVGIMATRLNAELLRSLLGPLSPDPVVIDPSVPSPFTGRILVAAGWKPGFSTDYDAVLLAEQFEAKKIIMLSNIKQIYDSDPKKNPSAKPLDHLSWQEYQKMMGSKNWEPGANTPFDPVASARAKAAKLTVIAASGCDLKNLSAILEGKEFVGTVIT